MDLAKLQEIANKLKSDKKSSSFSGEYPRATFMPEGTHKGRFIVDPDDEVYHKMFTYGYFSRGIEAPDTVSPYNPEDPDNKRNLPKDFVPGEDKLSQLSDILVEDYQKWGRGRKFNFLTYFYLTATETPSDDWQPGNLYCIVGNNRFADAFTDMLSSLVADSPEHLLKSLNPAMEGPIMQVTFSMGSQGKCNISPTFNTHPAIVERIGEDTDETYAAKMAQLGYRSLKYSYIYPGWNQEKYDNLCKQYEQELNELVSKRAEEPKDGEGSVDKTDEKPAEKAEDTSEKKEEVKEETKSETTESKQEEPAKEEVKDEPKSPPADDPFARYRKKS